MTRFFSWSLLLALVSFSGVRSFAQTDRLEGTVTDATGARISAASVTLLCDDKPAQQAHTDANGHYQFAQTTAACSLKVAAIGFSTVTRPIADLQDGNIVLSVQQVSNTVDVNANSGYVAVAATTATKTDTPLSEVPQAISVITRDQMDVQGVQAVPQALRYSAGMVPELRGINGGAYETLSGRGFIMEEYLDGMRLTNSAAGFLLPSFDPFDLQSIEVLHGPASVLFGQSYPAGLANLESKQPKTTTYRALDFTPGMYNRLQGDWDFSGPFDRAGHYLYRLVGLVRDTNSQVQFDEIQRYMIAPSFTWRPNEKTSLTALFNYQYDPKVGFYNLLPASGTVTANPFGIIPTSFDPGEPGWDKHARRQYNASYLFTRSLGRTWSIQQNFRYMHLGDSFRNVYTGGLLADNRTISRYSFVNNEHMDATTVDTHARATIDRRGIKQIILMGVDFQNLPFREAYGFDFSAPTLDVFHPQYSATIATPGYAGDDHVKFNQTGVYGQDQILYKRLAVTVGGREDWAYSKDFDAIALTTQKQSDHAFTGRAGAVFLAGHGISPYYSYSTSFQPSIGVDVEGKQFKPTTGQQHEIGLKYQPGHFNGFFTISAFNLSENNVLTTDPQHANFSVQTGGVRSRGIELESHTNLSNGVSVIAGYSFLDNEATSAATNGTAIAKGNAFYGTPRNIVSLWTDYAPHLHTLSGLTLGSGVRFIGSTYGDNANDFQVPSFTLVDAMARYVLPSIGSEKYRWQLSLNATNLSDRRYVSVCLNASSGCFYGARRNIIGNVGVRW